MINLNQILSACALSSHSRCIIVPTRPGSGKLYIVEGLGELTEMRSRRFHIAAIVFFALCVQVSAVAWAAAGQKSQADEWITECDSVTAAGTPDCSITVPFWQTLGEPKGSFALVVMLQTGNIGIVGQPVPVRALLRVDRNPPIECRQSRYCVFPSIQALAVLSQLKVGSLILIDVFTEKGAFNFSLTPKGYRAGMAQIRAWGYRTE
jgi:hypothetical protein